MDILGGLRWRAQPTKQCAEAVSRGEQVALRNHADDPEAIGRLCQPSEPFLPLLKQRFLSELREAQMLSRLIGLFCLVVVLAADVAQAQTNEPSQSPIDKTQTEALTDSAPVKIDGETLFEVPGMRSFPAKKRAAEIADRIIEVAREAGKSAVTVTAQPEDLGRALYAGQTLIMFLTEADAAFEKNTLSTVQKLRTTQIEAGILSYQTNRSTLAFQKGTRFTILWTVLYVLFLAGLWICRRRWRKGVEARISVWVESLEARSGSVIDASSALAAQRLLSRAIFTTIVALVSFYYVGRILKEFAFTKPVAEVLLVTLAAPVVSFLKTGADELPNLLTILFIVVLARFVLKLTLLVFRNIEAGLIQIDGFDKRWIWPTHRIVRFGIIIAAAVTAFPYVPGSQTLAFQGATVLLGLMLTLGANSIASNFLSGLVVVYKRSVNVGDRIKIGETIGVVEEMSIMDTHLRTYLNELVSIPNSLILTSEVVNLTETEGTNGILIKVPVGIGYDEAPKDVEELLLKAANNAASVKRTPKPFVLTPTLGSQDVTYDLHAYVKTGSRRIAARSELNRAILDVFESAGVQIMTPFHIDKAHARDH